MKTLSRSLAPWAGALALLAIATAPNRLSWAAIEPEASPIVSAIAIRGTINPATLDYLRMAIESAERASSPYLLVELDTPGGLVSSVREMAQAIDGSRVPVVVWVTPSGAAATSAGALLMLSAHVAAMSPGTNIGAATPVDSAGKDIPGALGKKAIADTAALARSLAEQRGRDVTVAQAFVAEAKSLSAPEAFAQRLIEILASDRAGLARALAGRRVTLGAGPAARVVTLPGVAGRAEGAPPVSYVDLPMSLGQRVLHLLANPTVATLLMTLGSLLIYVEITTPGVGVAGFLGATLLLVALMAFQLLPIQTGGLLLALLGLGLIGAELLVVSGGWFAFAGAVSLVLGMLWLFHPGDAALAVSPWVWAPLVVLLVGSALALVAFASRSLKLARSARERIGGGGLLGLAGYRGRVESVAEGGATAKVAIRGEIWDAVAADGDAGESRVELRVGDAIEVVGTHGIKLVVRGKLPGDTPGKSQGE